MDALIVPLFLHNIQMPWTSVATEPDRTGLKYAGTGPDRTGTGPDSGPSPVLVRFLRSFDGKNLKKLCRSA